MTKMTTKELAEYVLNHSLDEAISKCEEILEEYADEVEDWEDSLEQEEVMYNLENNLYPEDYTKKVKELLDKYKE